VRRIRWNNVRTIFLREVRDHLRDRRTLFMIVVLPILLYPILGISLIRFSELLAEKPKRVVLVGADALPDHPPLLDPDGQGFNPDLFDQPEDAAKLIVSRQPRNSSWSDPAAQRQALRAGLADVVVVFPEKVKDIISQLGRADIPIYYDSADEKSQFASLRVERLIERWTARIVRDRLIADQKPETYTEPVRAEARDVASPREAGGSVWARLFPFLIVMMALTGAFYPAIDGCAGEKERGTMETLLISPATRAEIVLGKFGMVWLASIATALLNLASMGLTAGQLASRLGSSVSSETASRSAAGMLTAPSLQSIFWMLILLIPLSAFFSAISLALSVMARSMKEGQYYLTPLYLVTMPLVFLTLAPGIELDLFTSLVPVTGVSLLLRSLMQANFVTARTFFLPVMIPLVLFSFLALRWAVEQFRRESVLFREAERIHLAGWLRRVRTDRPNLPNSAQAILCFAVMLASCWFLTFALAGSSFWGLILGQVGFVLGPALLLAFLFCRKPLDALRLRPARIIDIALGVLLAVMLHPLAAELRFLVERVFPVSQETAELLRKSLEGIPNLALMSLVLAIVPAVCEELAFRGFILTGLEQDYSRRWSIIISALLFGFLHVLVSLFQQLFNATILGLVLGLLAVRTRSVWPGVAFHVTNNLLVLLASELISGGRLAPLVGSLYRDPAQGLYHAYLVIPTAITALVLLALVYLLRAPEFWRSRPEPRTGPV
jgi:sodium transport system permease protein